MSQDQLPSQTFCILPWIHVFADTRGEIYPCCRVVPTGMPNVDKEGWPYRIQEVDDIEEAWNSGYMKKLRREMLDGQRPEQCRSCFMAEDHGVTSMRQGQNQAFAGQIPDALARTSEEGAVEPVILNWQLSPGNLCNLRCRMCYPRFSKALINEWSELHGADHPEVVEARQLDWHEKDDFWKRFEKFSPDVERLHFIGGEPLLSSQSFDFLERLIVSGKSTDIHLSYSTNLTVFPPRVFDVWPHFKSVTMIVSLDGYDQVNSLIRNPSNWKQIVRNLQTLEENADRLKCCWLGFNTTVQVYNIFYLDKLFEFTMDGLSRFEPYPNLSILEQPIWFSIQLLPVELKREAVRRLRAFQQRRAGRWTTRSGMAGPADPERFQKDLEGVIDHMLKEDRQDLIPEFVRVSQGFDQHRREKLCEVLPELTPLFEAEGA